jgi:hypothetical protein
MAVRTPSDQLQRVVALALDAAFYRATYPDVGAAGVDALRHYLQAGWREGRDPAPWFSTRLYLAANGDVAAAGEEPLHHYLTRGRYEGREVYPSDHAGRYHAAAPEAAGWSALDIIAPPAPVAPPPAAAAPPAQAPEPAPADAARELVVAEFDVAYYLGCHPDIEQAGADPLAHFLATGWREGRDPAPWFSVRDYLELYPDVAAAGLNPFVHYLQAGRSEGRTTRHDLGFRYEILAHSVPVEARVAAAVRATAAEPLDPAADLSRALAVSRTGLKRLHVTFSHDDYTANLGGMQLCLQREADRFASLGFDHLHLYPARPWPVVRQDEPGALGVVWNGAPVGVYAPAVIASVLGKAAPRRADARSFAIHSLLGHSVPETVAILAAVGLRAGVFWLHDFASLCAGFHLLRDDVADCAAPPPDSAACGVCVYGPWRARHLQAHEALFRALDLTVVSPSETTLAFWRDAWAFPAKGERVEPHATLVPRGPAPAAGRGPFRLAFAGMPAAHKGWPVFRELALRFAGDRRYEFLHLGARGVGGLPIGFEAVRVTSARPRAMQEALEAARADAVLVWPLCRETFSFTAYEAVAAGAAVLTHSDTGNVAAFVEAGAHGRVLADEAALLDLFETGAVRALSRARRKPSLYKLEFSDMTAGLLAAETPA